MRIKLFSMENYIEVYELWKKTGLTLGSSDTRDQVERILKRNPDLFLIGEDSNRIIAVVIGSWDGRRAYVHHLAVDPEYQGKGIGRMMMEELHKRFAENDYHKVHLFVEVENEGVIEFYKKVGWHVRDDLKMMSYVPKRSNDDK